MADKGERIILDSKMIEYVIYDKKTSVLEVKFKRGYNKGQLKIYDNFDSGAVNYVVNHESPGKALKSVLRKREKESGGIGFFKKLLSRFPFF